MPIVTGNRPVRRPRKQPRVPPMTDDEDRTQLLAFMADAVKTDRKQFGRPDCARIAAAVVPRLTSAQVQMLEDGAFGPHMACAVRRLRERQ
jgi:hypothetical protein